MRIFWHNGALQFLPESSRESEILVELSDNLKFEKPPEMRECTSEGNSPLGSEGLFEFIVRDKQTRPSGLTVKTNHKKFVTSINKLP